MAASLARVRQVQSLMPPVRYYSSVSAPVKRLGVIGAGQMVSSGTCDSVPDTQGLTCSPGIGNSFGSRTEGPSACNAR